MLTLIGSDSEAASIPVADSVIVAAPHANLGQQLTCPLPLILSPTCARANFVGPLAYRGTSADQCADLKADASLPPIKLIMLLNRPRANSKAPVGPPANSDTFADSPTDSEAAAGPHAGFGADPCAGSARPSNPIL